MTPAETTRTVVFRFMVEYVDSHGDATRDVFETMTAARERSAYLAARGRASKVWQV
ncbi:hypothetical protein [Nocardioides sp.]|uniref:hypothetical protein n=1 Tax=Nocardioides sp. TaxID=35761 RepID=UPI003218E357